MKKWLGLFSILVLAPISWADDDESPVTLKVKPVMCITDSRTPSCQMSFLVVWQSEQTGYYCVFNDFIDAPLRCWTDERAGELNDERNVESDFRYWVTGNDEDVPLTFVSVEVLRMDSDDRRRRRRGRHVWDIL